MAVDSLPRVDQVIAANRIQVGIRKKRERVARFLTKIARLLRSVYADRNRTNSRGAELIEILLNAPQLGVA